MAPWTDPVTDWDENDGIMYTDLNRIEENVEHLYDALHRGEVVTGTFSTTVYGFSVRPDIDIKYRISPFTDNFNKVDLWFPQTLSSEAGTNIMGLTDNLPLYLRRVDIQYEFYPATFWPAGSGYQLGAIRVLGFDGETRFYLSVATGSVVTWDDTSFPTSGTRGILSTLVSYPIPIYS